MVGSEVSSIGDELKDSLWSFGSGLESFFWFSARFVQFLILVIVLAAVIVFRKAIFGGLTAKFSDALRSRNLRRNLVYCLFCQCCPFGAKLASSTGFDSLAKANYTLVLTFVAVSEIKRSLNVYFEASTLPYEAASKATRTFHLQAGGEVPLNNERLELDWYGDEEELLIDLLEFVKGSPGGRLHGQLKISMRQIEKLTGESNLQPADLARGSRMFTIRTLVPKPAEPDMVRDMVLDQVRGSLGVDEELARLRDENSQMRALLDHSTNSDYVNTMMSQREQKNRVDLMNVVLRFQLFEKHAENVDVGLFHASSFHE